jgi:hypothetical protein
LSFNIAVRQTIEEATGTYYNDENGLCFLFYTDC